MSGKVSCTIRSNRPGLVSALSSDSYTARMQVCVFAGSSMPDLCNLIQSAKTHLEIGCCQNQDTPCGLEPVHLSKKLIDGVMAHTPTPIVAPAPH